MARHHVYKRWSERLKWSSLHGRVFVFTAGVLLLLLVALGILVNVLRRSQLLLIAGATRHTDALAQSLAMTYEDRSDRLRSLDSPASADRGNPPSGALGSPKDPGTPSAQDKGQGWLGAITSQVLRNDEKGVEGGFYRDAQRDFAGYTSRFADGAGAAQHVPEAAKSTLLRLGAQAVHSRQSQRAHSTESSDIVVFAAHPLCETRDCAQGAVGAAWTFERLPGAAADQRKAYFWGSLSFSLLAFSVIAFAYSVLANVERSTIAVLARLGNMESDLSPAAVSESPVLHLLEFQRMLDGVEHLGKSLTQQLNTERLLQGKLRHSERLASIGRLAAGVAHELRSPLATVRFRTQMAQRAAQERSVKEHCEVVLAEVDRLDGIIERLLAFSRPITLRRRSFDLGVLCEEVRRRWMEQLPEIQITSTCLETMPLFCDADESRIRQTLDNIVENAGHVLREEATPDPWIHIECQRKGNYAVVRVLDNGGGFPDEAIQRGTEPFFTTRTNGTGLGLAVTHEIIEAHQGALTIENRGRDGATVTFSIPLQSLDAGLAR